MDNPTPDEPTTESQPAPDAARPEQTASKVQQEREAKADSNALANRIGYVVIAVVLAVVVFFWLNDRASEAQAGPKRTVREGEFDIPDSKVLEFDNLRARLASQANTMSDDLKKLLEDNQRRDREMVEMRRQMVESSALGGSRGENIEQDLGKLSDAMRNLFPQAVEEMERFAIETGSVSYQDALPTFNPWVRKRVQTASDVEIERLAQVAQVRRKSPNDEQYVAIPSLATRRAALGIPKDNVSAIARMIWQRRATLPPMTAGQLLGMAHLTALTTQDAPVSTADVEKPTTPTASRPEATSTWTRAATGRTTLPEQIKIGPVSGNAEHVRLAVRAVTALVAEYATPAASPVEAKIKGMTYALGLSDARLLMSVGESPSDWLAVDRAIRAIEADAVQGSQIPVSVEVKDPRSPQIGVEQMVALRAVSVGATAAQTVLNAVEPTLDVQVLAGLVKSPGPEMISAALVADNKENAALMRLLDSALRRADGASGYPASVVQIKERVLAISPAIEEQARILVEAGVRPAAMKAFHRMALVVTALPYAVGSTTADLAKQRSHAMRNLAQIAVWVAASDLAEIDIRSTLIPHYAQNYLTLQMDWEALATREVESSRRVVCDAVNSSLLQGSTPEVVAAAISTIRRSTVPLAEGAVNRAIVRQIVLSSIAESSIGKDRLVVDSVREYMDSQIERLVIPEYTDERIRITAGTISRDCIAILTGKRNLPRKRVTEEAAVDAPSSPGRPGGGQPVRTSSNAGSGDAAQGDHWGQQELRVISFGPQSPTPSGFTLPMAGPANLSGQIVTLQSGSYGEAYLYSGGEVALGTTMKRTCLINLNHTWRGTGSIVRMRDMKILAELTPLPGSTTRMLIDLKRLSFRFPSGLLVERDCQGFVVDSVEGRDGIIAEMRLNLTEMAPLAAGSGLLAGLRTTLEAFSRPNTGSSVVINNNTGTQDGGKIPNGAYAAGALSGAAAPIEEYMRRSIGYIAPTMVAQNGQALTVVLTSPVVFDNIPAKEWATIMGNASSDAKLFR